LGKKGVRFDSFFISNGLFARVGTPTQKAKGEEAEGKKLFHEKKTVGKRPLEAKLGIL